MFSIALFIRKPILTISISMLILMLGIFGFMQMTIRFLPNMNASAIDINTAYSGMNNDVVKNFITMPIQNALVGIEGIDYMTSSSVFGMSDIKLYLKPNTNVEAISSALLQKLNNIQSELPRAIQSPVISVQNVDNQPMLILGFSSQSQERVDVADFLQREITPPLESISGVLRAEVWGDQKTMQILLKPDLLAAYHLSIQDILNALHEQHAMVASGEIESSHFNYLLNANTALYDLAEFNQMVIKNINHAPIYLHEVGEASWGGRNNNVSVYFDGKPTTMIGISILPTNNPIAVVDEVIRKMPMIANTLPKDIHWQVVLNRVDYIRASLWEVAKALIYSMLIVFTMLIIFLGNIRVAIIPALTVPLSLLGVCFIGWFLNNSINTMTLLAMVLAVGLVVDDAIVIVENAMRHFKQASSVSETTLMATQELVSPIIAMTAILAIVYLPIAFTGGTVGQLFKEFSLTLAGSVLVSGIIALTLSPLLTVYLLHSKVFSSRLMQWADNLLHRMELGYEYILTTIFFYKNKMVILWVALFMTSGVFYYLTPGELMPLEDQGFLLVIGNAPSHANLTYLEHYAKNTQAIYQSFPSIQHQAIVLSSGEGYQTYLLGSLLSQRESLQTALATVPGMDFQVVSPNVLSGGNSVIQFVLQTSSDIKSLYQIVKQIESEALQSGIFMYLYDDLHFTNPEANITIDHSAAEALNISMRSISDALSGLMSHQLIEQMRYQDNRYDVMIKTATASVLSPEDIESIAVATNKGTMVPLSAVSRLSYTVVPVSLNQFQKQNSVTIAGALSPGKTISEGLSVLKDASSHYLPASVNIDYGGNTRQYLQEGYRMLGIFALAFISIFFLLSVQFNSYRAAWVILLGSVPLAFFAGLLPLFMGWSTRNIYTDIGLLTLMGLISKHGILMVRYANELKITKNSNNQQAITTAAIRRLRPILMTTLAMVLGAIPLLLASGPGSASRHALGLVIGAGMGLGTVLTLVLLPVVYTVLSL
jgi:multidrug efflux pump